MAGRRRFLRGMWEAGGDFKFETVPHEYQTDFGPNFHLAAGMRDFDGLAYVNTPGYPDIDMTLRFFYLPGGAGYMMDLKYPNDVEWETLIRAQSSELDEEKRSSQLRDLQRMHAAKMYTISGPGASQGYYLWHRSMRIAGVFASRTPAWASAGQLHHLAAGVDTKKTGCQCPASFTTGTWPK